MFARSRLRLNAWIATLALLASVLAPSFAPLLKSAGLPVEICSVDGTRWVSSDASQDDPSGQSAAPHCPYCTLQAHLLALPPAPAALVLAAGLSHAAPLPAPASTRPLPLPAGGGARAPPAFG